MDETERRRYVAVVGAGDPGTDTDRLAYEVGRLLASRGAVLVCGGLTGVMEHACRGAKDGGGTTVGILPSTDKRHANPHVDVAIATGMGEMRNALIVRTADAVIAIGGGFGTLSEIAFALKLGRPVFGLSTWDLERARPGDGGVVPVDTPGEAVRKAMHST
ncbi:MAG: TIGR00725 family protein [Actinomycetota bacterium]